MFVLVECVDDCVVCWIGECMKDVVDVGLKVIYLVKCR